MAESPKTKFTYANNNLFDNKNIKFLSGTQADLNKYLLNSGQDVEGTAIEGAFYLTLDTHRLYIGRKIIDGGISKVIPVPVNEGIYAVDSLSNLPDSNAANAGEFYYINDTNILCIYNGQDWVLINPDTDTTVELDQLTFSSGHTVSGTYSKATTYNASQTYYTCDGASFNEVLNKNANNLSDYYIKDANEGKTLVYTITAHEKKLDKNNSAVSGYSNLLTAYLVIPISDLTGVSKLGITSNAVVNNNTLIKLDGEFADNTKTISINGGTGISITGNAAELNISGKTYEITKTANSISSATIGLEDESENFSGTINIVAGDSLNLTADTLLNNNNIIINHSAAGSAVSSYLITPDKKALSGKTYYTYNSGTSTYSAASVNAGEDLSNLIEYYESVTTYGNNPTALFDGATLRIPTISIDNKGHVSNIKDTGVVLPSAVKVSNIAAGANGTLVITNNDTTSVTSNNRTLYYTMNIDGQEVTKVNQENLGSFYSADKINNLIETELRGLNALTYKGVLSTTTMPTTAVLVGDTYLVGDGIGSLTFYDGNSNASHAVTAGDLLVAAGNEYVKSADTTVVPSKVYYTKSTVDGKDIYTKVAAPSGNPSGNPGYYENQGYINGTITWTLIKAGDIDTTYALTYNTLSSNSSIIKLVNERNENEVGQLNFVAGNYITINNSNFSSNGSLIFNHAESDVISSSAANISVGPTPNALPIPLNSHGTFTIPSVVVDRYGHITSASNVSYLLPTSNSDFYKLKNGSVGGATPNYDTILRLWKNDNSVESTVEFTGDASGGVNVAANATSGNIEITHSTKTINVTAANINNPTTISHKGNFSVLTNITADNYGHIANVTYTNFALPEYKLVSTFASNTASLTLYDASSAVPGSAVVNFSSNTLSIAHSVSGTTHSYTVDLEWQTF